MDNEQLAAEIKKRFDAIDRRLDEIGSHIITLELEHLDIADRHESLAQVVEIMAAEGRRLQSNIGNLLRITTGLVELSRRHDKRLGKLEGDAA